MDTTGIADPVINLFQLDSTDLSWHNSLGTHPPHKTMIQLARHKRLSDALVFSGAPLFKEGEWFLDSRYKLKDNINLAELPRAADDKITVYKVAALPNDPVDKDRTTHAEDTMTHHGGLFYVGYQALRLLIAYKNRELLCEKLLVPVDAVATTRRYKYPVVVLHSQWDELDAYKKVANELTAKYRAWGPDVRTVRSVGTIREGHAQVLKRLPQCGHALVIDADFVPNGNPALMYEPSGDETRYVHLWHTDNIVNRAVYGHGSPKLIGRRSFDLSREGEDMTMSCAVNGITIHPTVVGTHAFHRDKAKMARTLAREVYKLKKAAKERGRAENLEAFCEINKGLPDEDYTLARNAIQAGLDLVDLDIDINDFAALTNYLETRSCLA